MILTGAIVFLVIVLGVMAIFVIIGWIKPWGWTLAGLISGTIFYSYLEGWANYEEYVIQPAIEWALGTRVPGIWEFMSMYSLIVFAFMIFAFTYNMYYSWYRMGLILPVIEFVKPEK